MSKSIENRIDKLEKAIRLINKEPEPFPVASSIEEAEKKGLKVFVCIPRSKSELSDRKRDMRVKPE